MIKTVDVIIPTYNSERFIMRVIKSVWNQTYLPESIIIVDDGSYDNTVKIIEDVISKSPIKIIFIRLDKNYGPAYSRNTGISKSKSELIVFLDSDDELYPQMIEKFFDRFNRDDITIPGIVYCRKEYFDESLGKSISNEKQLAENKKTIVGVPGLDLLMESIDCISVGGFMIRRDVIESIGGFDQDLRLGEDWDLYLRLAEKGILFDCIDEILVRINWHSSNTIKSELFYYGNIVFINKWLEVIKVCEKRRNDFKYTLLYHITKNLPNIEPYLWLKNNMSNYGIKIIFGDLPFSLELKIIKKFLLSIFEEVRNFIKEMIKTIVRLFFLKLVEEKYINSLILIKNGLFFRKFIVMADDKTVSKFYKENGYWELPLSLYLKRITETKLNIIDVGANIGYFSSLFAKSVKPKGTICSVEANSSITQILKDNVNFAINGRKNKDVSHIIINKIAWKSVGEVKKFYQLNTLVGNSSVFKPNNIRTQEGFTEEEVFSIDLDSVCEEYNIKSVDIIRIDAEGSEAEILQGAKKIISNNTTNIIIICEYLPYLYINNNYSSRKLLLELKLLSDMGFRIFRVNSLGFLKEVSIKFLKEGYSGDIVIKR